MPFKYKVINNSRSKAKLKQERRLARATAAVSEAAQAKQISDATVIPFIRSEDQEYLDKLLDKKTQSQDLGGFELVNMTYKSAENSKYPPRAMDTFTPLSPTKTYSPMIQIVDLKEEEIEVVEIRIESGDDSDEADIDLFTIEKMFEEMNAMTAPLKKNDGGWTLIKNRDLRIGHHDPYESDY